MSNPLKNREPELRACVPHTPNALRRAMPARAAGAFSERPAIWRSSNCMNSQQPTEGEGKWLA